MSEISNVAPAEAKELVDSGKYTLLDVRYGCYKVRRPTNIAAPGTRLAARRQPPPGGCVLGKHSPAAHPSYTRPLLRPPCAGHPYCRTPEEYALGAAPGSVNIPVKLDDGNGGMVPNPDFVAQARHVRVWQCQQLCCSLIRTQSNAVWQLCLPSCLVARGVHGHADCCPLAGCSGS